MHPSYQMYFLEEFVQRPPRDIRAIVIGDTVAGAIYRVSNDINWKTNTHLGGSAEICEVSNELEDICIKARLPVLVIVGEHDAITPPDETEAFAATVPDAHHAVIPGAGHMPPMENTAECVRVLAQFWDGLE